jgi:hypothetical protein
VLKELESKWDWPIDNGSEIHADSLSGKSCLTQRLNISPIWLPTLNIVKQRNLSSFTAYFTPLYMQKKQHFSFVLKLS